MFSKEFLKDMAERLIATFAEGLLGGIGASAITIGEVHWGAAFSAAGLATLVALLKAIAASKKGDSDSASLIK